MTEDGQPPPKRPRTVSIDDEGGPVNNQALNPATALSALERDSEFWLDDGNIVLVAGGAGFKVYKGLLAAQSPVFGDMFSASNVRPDEQYDSVPIVRLFDSPVDLRHLLRVLLPKSQKDVMKDKYDHKTEFHIMSALIRLAHKYQIDDVEKRAISALASIYTTDLCRWIEFENTVDEDFCAIAAVNLARLTDTPSILPSALFNCALLGSNIFDGYVREDGSVDHLSQDDLKRCINATPILSVAQAAGSLSLALSAQRAGSTSCLRPGPCGKARRSVYDNIQGGLMRYTTEYSVDALGGTDPYWTGVGLCQSCVAKLEDDQMAFFNGVWANLPSMFGIEEIVGTWPGVDVAAED